MGDNKQKVIGKSESHLLLQNNRFDQYRRLPAASYMNANLIGNAALV